LKPIEDILTPFNPPWSKSVHHLFVIRCKDRDALVRELGQHRIGTGLHYPVPIHLQKAYSHLGHEVGDFPVTERLASEVISLPMSTAMLRRLPIIPLTSFRFCSISSSRASFVILGNQSHTLFRELPVT